MLNNYGWRVWEGRSRYQSGQRTNRHGRLVFPIVVYKHTNNNCSVTGGYVYRGKAVPAARGRYFYGDYCSGKVWSLRAVHGKLAERPRPSGSTSGRSRRSGADTKGELYATSLDGQLYKLVR